jgi:MFS family permease
MGGVGAAAGPLIGGLITTTVSWRASFLLQAAIVLTIIWLSRRLVDPLPPDPSRPFDTLGAALSAIGMFFLVIGILQADTDWVLFAVFVAAGALFQLWFFIHIRSMERAGKEPLLSTGLFRVRTSNLALVTQHIQWLMLMGISFVVSVFLQIVRGYSAIQTGLVFTAATVGVLISSLLAERFASRRAQRSLILAGFVVTIAGISLILALAQVSDEILLILPGLFLIGFGVGGMLTPSVNVVQSAFPEERQGEISGLSRSVSNLGSSLGTAIAGTILVANLADGNQRYEIALVVLGALGLIGLWAAWLLPSNKPGGRTDRSAAA